MLCERYLKIDVLMELVEGAMKEDRDERQW